MTKKFSAARIEEAYRCGCRDFGENYVQEFAEKWPTVKALAGTRFHLIGHLQSNKARLATDMFDVIQTVDSPKLLRRLDTAAEEKQVVREVMLEVKLSAEVNKTGCEPERIPELLEAARTCQNVRVTGLMTMPPWSEDAELSRPYFRRLAELAKEHGLEQLSMGMSNDLEVAIEEGATIVRVGTALFGARPKPASSSGA